MAYNVDSTSLRASLKTCKTGLFAEPLHCIDLITGRRDADPIYLQLAV